MQQFQDDIMRNRKLALDIEEKLSRRIEYLEQRLQALEKLVSKDKNGHTS